jgi:hypothetical protein
MYIALNSPRTARKFVRREENPIGKRPLLIAEKAISIRRIHIDAAMTGVSSAIEEYFPTEAMHDTSNSWHVDDYSGDVTCG